MATTTKGIRERRQVRVFGGKRYYLLGEFDNKGEARRWAAKAKGDGGSARIVSAKPRRPGFRGGRQRFLVYNR